MSLRGATCDGSTVAVVDSRTIDRRSVIWGERRPDPVVFIDNDPLRWESTLRLADHSPDGPEWGYGGSGPAQLALAVLCVVAGDDFALRHYQQFKRDFVAPIGNDFWVIAAGDVLDWVQARRGRVAA